MNNKYNNHLSHSFTQFLNQSIKQQIRPRNGGFVTNSCFKTLVFRVFYPKLFEVKLALAWTITTVMGQHLFTSVWAGVLAKGVPPPSV